MLPLTELVQKELQQIKDNLTHVTTDRTSSKVFTRCKFISKRVTTREVHSKTGYQN